MVCKYLQIWLFLSVFEVFQNEVKALRSSIAGDREPESLAPQGSLEEKDRGGALGRLRWWQGPQGEVRAQRSSHHGSPPEHPAAVLDCGSGCSACSTAQRLRFLDITRCDCGCSACSTGSVASPAARQPPIRLQKDLNGTLSHGRQLGGSGLGSGAQAGLRPKQKGSSTSR